LIKHYAIKPLNQTEITHQVLNEDDTR